MASNTMLVPFAHIGVACLTSEPLGFLGPTREGQWALVSRHHSVLVEGESHSWLGGAVTYPVSRWMLLLLHAVPQGAPNITNVLRTPE